MKRTSLIILLLIQWLTASAQPWNRPHEHSPDESVYHTSIPNIPKTFDPAKSFSADESVITSQIYEPPYQYHYLKRPYTLVPLTATELPTLTFYNAEGKIVDENSPNITKTVYDIEIQSGIYYQPHPAFVKEKQSLNKVRKISDFKKTATKELTADDYIYEIKRLASPKVSSPIFGVMREHIIGFNAFSKKLESYLKKNPQISFLDLDQFSISGVKKISRYRYQISVNGKYLQFKYWLAMPFFAPIPKTADQFYSQPELKSRNISLSTYPVGTGPYMLTENNPNKRILLVANPNFHQEFYPSEGEINDYEQGFLKKAGMKLPFIKELIFSIEKESIPRWNKFLQGYYDKEAVTDTSFDQAVQLDKNGNAIITDSLKKKGVRLSNSIAATTFYLGFNMLDPIVGGYSEEKRKLRQAISIAINNEELISVFFNGLGVAAQSIIPPSVFGYLEGKQGYNPYVYSWIEGKLIRKSLDYAKNLLAEAGYPGGKDPKTGKQLVLNYDVTTSGNPSDKLLFEWYRQQFAKLGIDLNIQSTLYNRFQDKVRTGKAQLFFFGWIADYPDPENFLFLLYGPNAKVPYGGENATNYKNPKADQLFETIRDMPNGAERQSKINQWLDIVRKDAPMVWQFHPISMILSHQWIDPTKPGYLIRNAVKYMHINPQKRDELTQQWNQPIIWVLVVLFFLTSIFLLIFAINYWRRTRKIATKRFKE